MGTGWLCGLLIALTLITLIGHGIWVFVASLLKAGKRPAPRGPAEQAGDELFRAEVQINRLAQAGLLDEGTRLRVVSAMGEARQRRAQPVPVLPVAMPPIPAPAVAVAPPPLPTPSAIPPNGKRAVEAPAVSAARRENVQPVRPVAEGAAPSRPFSEVVAAFMRQSNIRWGELIGGLLIVGCSVALVISFWNEIRGHAFFQFGIFTGVTTALMGLGLYAEHRWKLPTTSRGILLIATLLVPLNFLAFAALAHGAPPSILVTAAEVAALGLFGFLVWRAAAILAPYWPRLLSVGVIASSASLVIIRHLGPAQSAGGLLAQGAVPIASYGAAMGVMLGRARRWQRVRAHTADALFVLLGILTFGATLGVALVIFQTGVAFHAAHQLASLLSLGTMPALMTGLLLWRRVKGRRLAGVRTVGTAIALAAASLMVGMIALAWPDAGSILPLATVDFVALTLVAVLFEFPVLHALAGGCLLLAYLVGFHIARHHIGWTSTPGEMFEALHSPSGGAALIPLFLLTGATSFILQSWRRSADARIYRLVSIVVAGISLALTAWGGLAQRGDPFGASWVYLFYAAIAVWVASRWRRADASWAAWMLFLASMAQFLAARQSDAISWATGLLAYATMSTLVCLLAGRFNRDSLTALARPARWLTVLASAAGTILLLANLAIASSGAIWPRVAWVAGLWIVMALTEGSAGLFALGQVGFAVATAIGIVSQLAGHAWFHQSPVAMLEPWTLQSIGVAVAVLCLGWSALRQALPQRLAVRQWLEAPWSTDRILWLALLGELTLLCIYAGVPGIGAEFAIHPVGPPPIGYAHAAGIGSWALLAVLLLTLATWLQSRTAPLAILLIVTMGCMACMLCAAHWNGSAATASALRWALSVYLLLISAPLWARQELPLAPQRFAGTARNVRTLVFALTSIPVLLLSIYPAGEALSGLRIIGPAPGSFFAAIGNATSYSVPLLLVASACIGNSVRDRSPTWVFGGSLVLNLTTTLGYGLAVATSGDRFDAIHLIRLVQLNTITLAAFALAWQLVRSLRERELAATQTPGLLSAQLMAALGGNVLLLAPAAVSLFVFPQWGAAELAVVGDPLGWVGLVMTIAAAYSIRGGRIDRLPLGATASGLAALSLMVAFAATRVDTGDWRAYHVLMAGLSVSASAMLALAFVMTRRRAGWAEPTGGIVTPVSGTAPGIVLQYQRRDQTAGPPVRNAIYLGSQELCASLLRCLPAFTGILALLAVRAMFGDPQRPWWSVATTVILSLLWTAVAWWASAPRLLYVGGLMLNVAATMWCVQKPWASSTAPFLDLICANVAVLSLSGLAAMVLEFQVFNLTRRSRARLPFHGFAALVSTAAVLSMAGLTIGRDVLGIASHASVLMNWAAVGSAAILVAVTFLWDAEAPFAPGQLYALGLAAIAVAIDGLGLPANRIGWAAAILLAGYVLLTGTIGGFRRAIRRQLGQPTLHPAEGPRAGSGWLTSANLVLSAAVIALSLWVDFAIGGRGMRLAAAGAAMVQVVGLVLGARSDRRLDSRQAALWVGALAAVVFAWAWREPTTANLLDRSVALLAALACTITLYGFLVAQLLRKGSFWSIATRSLLAPLAGIWAIVLLEILGAEVAMAATRGSVVMHATAIGAVIAALVGSAAACLMLALNPARDPLQLQPARRGAYVYAAEALLGLTFLHLRLTMPQLFTGLLAQYWPLIVMGLAFAGVGLGEIFRRRRLPVLSDPLFRTGIFLPILPALAYWLLPPCRVDYAYLLFTAGLFYAILSATRKSFVLGVLAALAANGGFWTLLAHEPQLGFFMHPQLWLIPAAASVLVAAQLNADRLSLPQLRAIRYACLIVVYVSSTADVFLNGVSRAPWLPMVLAALSVAGVMLGILFRVRSFLVLGTAFLSLAVLTMIYYASANLGWTWLWYVAGIALGSGIIATFALFEKRRAEMVALVEGLKQWQ